MRLSHIDMGLAIELIPNSEHNDLPSMGLLLRRTHAFLPLFRPFKISLTLSYYSVTRNSNAICNEPSSHQHA